MRYISSIIILIGFIVALGWVGMIDDTGQTMPSAIFVGIGIVIMGFGRFIAVNYPYKKKSRRPYGNTGDSKQK